MLSEIMNKIATQEIAPAITVKDVAVYLNVDEKIIYRLAQKGELPGFKVAGSWRVEVVDIKKWVDGRKMVVANKVRKA
jgi:excisionase family DNA binding protein